MLTRHLPILLTLGATLSGQVLAQTPGRITLSKACFDSLPYNTAHSCEAFSTEKSKATLEALYRIVSTKITADSLTVAVRDSSDMGVLIAAPPQTPHGICAARGSGPTWISPSIAIHFDATRLSKEETRYVILVRGSAVSTEGNTGGSMALALCYLGLYAVAVEEASGRPSGD